MKIETYKGIDINFNNKKAEFSAEVGAEYLASKELSSVRSQIDKVLKKSYNRVPVVKLSYHHYSPDFKDATSVSSDGREYRFSDKTKGYGSTNDYFIVNEEECKHVRYLMAEAVRIREEIKVETQRLKTVLEPLSPEMVDPSLAKPK